MVRRLAAESRDVDLCATDTLSKVLALKVAYNGQPFSGYARQPERYTVQGELERALQTLLRRSVDTTCAGRTDAGVHAKGQVVSFKVSEEELAEVQGNPPDVRHPDARPTDARPPFARFMRSLNALTPEEIAIRDVNQCADGFSARFDAKAREYRYFIAQGSCLPVFARDFSWWIPARLDVARMQRASECLLGEHDFKSFCRSDSAVGKPTCRNVMEVSFVNEDFFGEELLMIKVVGSSFLHSMVRTLTGSLVMVGKGLRDEAWLKYVLEAKDRTVAGETAPAQGLVLWEVRY